MEFNKTEKSSLSLSDNIKNCLTTSDDKDDEDLKHTSTPVRQPNVNQLNLVNFVSLSTGSVVFYYLTILAATLWLLSYLLAQVKVITIN